MNSTRLANWSEILSSFAILVTLIFLVVQMRQNTQAIESSSSQAALDAEAEFLVQAVEHPEAILSWTKPDPTDKDVLLHYYSLVLFMRGRESMWAQYNSGAMDTETWQRYSRPIPLIFQYPGNRAWWRNEGRSTFDPDFVAMVDGFYEATPIAQTDLVSVLRQLFETP